MKFKILLLFDGEDYFFSEGLLPSLLGLSFVFTLILSMSVLGNEQCLVMSVMGNISQYAHCFSHNAHNLEHSQTSSLHKCVSTY